MRFYNLEYPNVDDIVICLITKIDKEVIYTELLEYDNIQGIIQLSNASTRRKKRSVLTVKEGKIFPLLVLTIDKEKGYIDLSNKFLSDEDKAISMEKYNFQSKANKIFNHFFNLEKENNMNLSKEEYALKTIWKLDKYKCYEYLKNEYLEKGDLEIFDLTDKEKQYFKQSLSSYFGSYNINSYLIIRVINTNFGGVNSIIELFKLIENKYGEIFKLLVAPKYKIEVNSEDKQSNENKLNEIYNFIEEYCQTNKFILNKEVLKSEFT